MDAGPIVVSPIDVVLVVVASIDVILKGKRPFVPNLFNRGGFV